MGILERIKRLKREAGGPDPFLAQLIAVEVLSDPLESGKPHAVYTLSDLDKKEVWAFSGLIAIESVLEELLGRPTALRAFIDSQLLLRRSLKRRGERALIEAVKSGGQARAPILLKPVQRILSGVDEGVGDEA